MPTYRSEILKAIVLPIADMAMKTSITSSLKLISQMRGLSDEEIKNWQSKKLRELINHAYKNTNYYNSLFNRLNINPDQIRTIEDLKNLPILTKQDITNNYHNLIPKNIGMIPHNLSATGGSSGDPMRFLLDHKTWSFANANTIFNWERTGYSYGDKHIALGSTSLFVDRKPSFKHRIFYNLKNKIGLNGVNMSATVCGNYVDFIKKEKIRYIYGYASAIYLLAKWVIDNQEYVEIDACFTTSEVLTDQFRKTIKSAFNCKILDCYGAQDGGIMAFAHQEGYFEVGYNCLVRLDNNSNQGAALFTDLMNYAMPFINYKIGDELVKDSELNNNYSYNGQIVNQVMGRTSDLIQLDNGNTLTGPGFTILFKDLPVDYYCIEKISGDTIKCYIKKLPTYSSYHEDLILATFNKHMGSGTYFSIEYTETVRYTKGGKRIYFVDSI